MDSREDLRGQHRWRIHLDCGFGCAPRGGQRHVPAYSARGLSGVESSGGAGHGPFRVAIHRRLAKRPGHLMALVRQHCHTAPRQ